MRFEDIRWNGKTYQRCLDCGRFGRQGWKHDCAVSTSWFLSIEDIERQNAVIHASKVLDLHSGATEAAVEEVLGRLAELLAIWPHDMRTAAFVWEVQDIASRHLGSIGIDDAGELVQAAVMEAINKESRALAREQMQAQREREIETKAQHVGMARQQMLSALAATMRRGGAEQETIEAALVAENRRCVPPLLPKELTDIARTVALYAPSDVPRTRDLAVAIKKATKGPPPAQDEHLPNFRVDKVLIADSDPPRYWLTIDGKEYQWSAAELSSATRFKLRFITAVRRVPLRLPKSPEAWDELVDSWLAKATTVQQPPDASPEILVRDHVSRGLEGLAVGDGILDLESGKGIVHDGRFCFKSIAAVRIARELDGRIGSHEVCDHLRILGFDYVVVNLHRDPPQTGFKAIRVWRAPVGMNVDGSEEAPPATHGGNGHEVAPVGVAPPSAPEDRPEPTPPTPEDPDETFDLPL
ncbi:MAG: hypothetical protein ACRD1X_22165 [Vicinamibacteria bacterium]